MERVLNSVPIYLIDVHGHAIFHHISASLGNKTTQQLVRSAMSHIRDRKQYTRCWWLRSFLLHVKLQKQGPLTMYMYLSLFPDLLRKPTLRPLKTSSLVYLFHGSCPRSTCLRPGRCCHAVLKSASNELAPLHTRFRSAPPGLNVPCPARECLVTAQLAAALPLSS